MKASHGSIVLAYDSARTLQTSLGSCFTASAGDDFQGVAVDPYTNDIYVSDYANGAVITCTESGGSAVGGTFSGLDNPDGMVVVGP